MKRKNMVIFLLSLFLILVIYALSRIYINGIDSDYAKKYADVLCTKDIKLFDKYFNSDTLVFYKDISGEYINLRQNLQNTFSERKYNLFCDSSYGNGNDKFINGIQKISIESFIQYNSRSIEVPIEMEIEIIGMNKIKIKSIRSDSIFFGNMYFGEKIHE